MKDIVIDKKLEKSCPQGYPWDCWMCQKNVWCSRPKESTKENTEDKK